MNAIPESRQLLYQYLAGLESDEREAFVEQMQAQYGDDKWMETIEEALSSHMDGEYSEYDDGAYIPDDGDSAEMASNVEVNPVSLNEMAVNCMTPTFHQVIKLMTQSLMLAMLLPSVAALGNAHLVHLTSVFAGLALYYLFFSSSIVHMGAYLLIAYVAFVLFHVKLKIRRIGLITALLSFIYVAASETMLPDRKVWHQIRGAVMICMMKQISLGFDLDSDSIVKTPSLVEYFGYVFCPGTCIFGPWVSFNTYMTVLTPPKSHVLWLARVVKSGSMALTAVLVSNCISQWIIQYLVAIYRSRWSVAFATALSFRFSHYFVCFLSEMSVTAAGIRRCERPSPPPPASAPADKNQNSSENNALVEKAVTYDWLTVSRPSMTELPRSLVEVVVFWNLPMHEWLKTYVFRIVRPYSNFAAVLMTYLASSLLHGFNFQLSAVLLSLGVLTYFEHGLRRRLARIFSACVESRKCSSECSHQHKADSPATLLANVSFTLLAMWNLAYLGAGFDSSESHAEGYSMRHALTTWRQLGFGSHIATFVLIFCYLSV